VFLDLPDRETAVKYLLEVFNTKSNPINQDSLNQWMEELDVTLEELDVSMDDLHVEIEDNMDDYADDLPKDNESAMPKKPTIEIQLETVNDLEQLKNEIEKIAAEMYLDIKVSVDYE